MRSTPDRPGDVQVAVAVGTKRPTAWAEVPIELAHLRTFSLDGTERRDLHGWEIAVATPEKVLSDSALVPGRVGGIRGLARIATRAQDSLDWREAVRLFDAHPNGLAAMRRLAALLDVVETPVPKPLPAERPTRDNGSAGSSSATPSSPSGYASRPPNRACKPRQYP